MPLFTPGTALYAMRAFKGEGAAVAVAFVCGICGGGAVDIPPAVAAALGAADAGAAAVAALEGRTSSKSAIRAFNVAIIVSNVCIVMRCSCIYLPIVEESTPTLSDTVASGVRMLFVEFA